MREKFEQETSVNQGKDIIPELIKTGKIKKEDINKITEKLSKKPQENNTKNELV